MATGEDHMLISANPGTHTNRRKAYLDRCGRNSSTHQHLEAREDVFQMHLLPWKGQKRLLDNNEIMQALNAAPLWKVYS